MKKKDLFLKITSAVCLASLISGLLAGCGATVKEEPEEETETTAVTEPVYFTDTPGSLQKRETVYVNLDTNGSVKSTVVSDWLHTDKGSVKVSDKSDLKDIVNIKSAVEPVRENGGLTWHMDSTDLYYRGTSDKELPVDITIDYYLDGKKLDAKEIAGKKGESEIRINVKNKAASKAKIGGKEVTIYTPFIVAGGMILPEDTFTAITAVNGTAIGDGSKEIVAFVGVPVMSETLALDKTGLDKLNINLADSFAVKAKTESFELGNMYFAVLPLSSVVSELGIPETLEDVREIISKLSDVSEALSSIDVSKLIEILSGSGDKVKELTDLVSQAVELYESNKVLLELLPKYLTEENVTALSKLLEDMDSSNLKEVAELLNRPVMKSFVKNLPGITGSLTELMPVVEAFEEDMKDPEVQKAVDNLPQTLLTLGELQSALNENKELIDTLMGLLTEENLEKINSLLENTDPEKTNEALESYGVLAENADEITARLSAALSEENEYDIFTQAPDNAETSVIFIYQTPGISK